MARCCYETLLSSLTFSCEGAREDVGHTPHVEAFHRMIRTPGKSPADLPESPYYCQCIAHLTTDRRNFGRVYSAGQQ